jgi:hypothetical protein
LPYNFIINDNNVLAQAYPFIASTRNFFDVDRGNLIQERNLPSALSILNINNCPPELAIYVHGVWADEDEAEEQTERVFLSIRKEGSNIPVIGFSWDSDTAFSLDNIDLSQRGWRIAKQIANENGPILAKFIDSFKDECQGSKLRIIAHSLGSRVTLSAIQSLYDNNIHATILPSKTITSVHLLGAAVDDEQVSINERPCNNNRPPLKCSGIAIYSEVENFYSLYNPEDNMLVPEEILFDPFSFFPDPFLFDEFIVVYPSPYQYTEGDDPLGSNEVKSKINEPFNYNEYSVLSKIKYDDDADKDNMCDLEVNFRYYYWIWYNNYWCTIDEIGDNHFGYMGYRSSINPQRVSDSGAMEFVVLDWRNENN